MNEGTVVVQLLILKTLFWLGPFPLNTKDWTLWQHSSQWNRKRVPTQRERALLWGSEQTLDSKGPHPATGVENHQTQGFALPDPELIWVLCSSIADAARNVSFCPEYTSVYQECSLPSSSLFPIAGSLNINQFPPGLESWAQVIC